MFIKLLDHKQVVYFIEKYFQRKCGLSKTHTNHNGSEILFVHQSIVNKVTRKRLKTCHNKVSDVRINKR